MTLTAVRLAQFRSWRRLDLSLDAAPLALVGPNGAGKTNILEAVSMLAPGRGLRGAPAAEQGRQGAGAGWRVRALAAGHEIETGAAPGSTREVLLDGKSAPQAALGRILRLIWLVPSMDRLWTDPPEQRRRFLDRLTLSISPDHAEAALAYGKAMTQRNRLLRDQVSDPGWYRALEAQMAEAGALITRNRLAAIAAIAEAQDVDGEFPAARLALLAGDGFADDTSEADIAGRLSAMRSRDLAAGRSLVGPHRADLGASWGPQDMPAALSSTGEQKALLLSLILANARALSDQRPVLLLDEVAAHLDADRRAALYARLAALPAQTLLTGTGAELFDRLEGRVLQVARDGDGASTLRSPGPGSAGA